MKLPQEVLDQFKKLGRKGGLARAARLTPERRREIAVTAGKESGRMKKARKEWDKHGYV